MKRNNIILVALGILSTFSLGPSPAEAQNDFYALYNRYRFHQVGYSARSAAMGGAYSALQDAENSLYGNPAALGFQKKPFIMGGFDWEDVASDITMLNPNNAEEAEAEMWSLNFAGLYPFEWGVIGLQYGYRSDDLSSDAANSIAGYMEQNGDLDRHFGGVGFGYEVMENLSLGYRFGYFDYELDRDWDVVRPFPYQFECFEEDFQGHRHQLGAQYVVNEQVVLGIDGAFAFGDRDITLQSSALDFNTDADSYSIRGGVAWKALVDIPLLVSLDVSFDRYELDGAGSADEDLIGIHFGAEYEVYENLFLRAGYQFEDYDYTDVTNLNTFTNIDESFNVGGYSAGIGYKYNQINFDYAFMYLDTGSGDMAHYFSVGYEF